MVIEKLLKQIGLPADKIKEVIAADKEEKSDFDIAPIVDAFKENQRALFENDGDLAEKFYARERGKQLDIVTNQIKKAFGLTSDLIKDKKIAEVIELAKAESTKGLSKEMQQLQEEALAAANKVKEYEETLIPQIKSEVAKEKKQFLINNKMRSLIPGADKLRVPAETVDKIVNADILSQYDLDMDEKGNITLFEKGKTIHAKSADGTKLLTITDAMNTVLTANKFIKESNADDNGAEGGKGGEAGKTKIYTKEEIAKMPLGQQKAIEHSQRLAEEAKARAAENQ